VRRFDIRTAADGERLPTPTTRGKPPRAAPECAICTTDFKLCPPFFPVACFNPDNRHKRKETERFKSFTYDELTQRDKASLDIFWLKDESLEDTDNLPDPDVLATEIADSLEAALEQFRGIAKDLEV
jgi:hypothetical protein